MLAATVTVVGSPSVKHDFRFQSVCNYNNLDEACKCLFLRLSYQVKRAKPKAVRKQNCMQKITETTDPCTNASIFIVIGMIRWPAEPALRSDDQRGTPTFFSRPKWMRRRGPTELVIELKTILSAISEQSTCSCIHSSRSVFCCSRTPSFSCRRPPGGSDETPPTVNKHSI